MASNWTHGRRALVLFALALLSLYGCKSSGLQGPAGSVTAPHESDPEDEIAGPNAPVSNPVSWTEPDKPDRGFELLTEPGELPFIKLAASDDSERLPLEHTHVSATLHGLVAEVEVTQTYANPHHEPIEAIYVFPLPENSAVNHMEMQIGKRRIEAKIEERQRAQHIYDDAKRQGFTAALLEQERPNIFTQSVANIAPGEKIEVVVRYVQDLSYDQGEYEFVFPMVVGPRYMPGAPARTRSGDGTEPDTTRVPDASRISPAYVGKGQQSGHDVSLELQADAGFPIASYRAVTHHVVAHRPADGSLRLTLAEEESRPNRDFVLRYRTVADRPQAVLYTSPSGSGQGYFSLVIEPPALDVDSLVGRREVIFVVDVSGSMSGTPLAMCRNAMRTALEALRPLDTFNVITFAGHTTRAFPSPRPANRHNVSEALRVVSELRAGGGTEMANAIDAALAPAVAGGRNRYVFFMTDGYVGNEAEIIEKSRSFVKSYQRHGVRARVFGFGVGSSPNRYLLGGLSQAGQGIALYASNREDPNRAVNQFYHYIDSAVLSDVRIDWGSLEATQVYPNELPDLFASHPIVLHGRYRGAVGGGVRVLGKARDRDLTLNARVEPARTAGKPSEALGALWARARVDRLEEALLDGSIPDAQARITQLGLDHHLVTRFTSFVAVDASRRVSSGDPRQVLQPAERPEGVDLSMAGRKEARTFTSSTEKSAARKPAPAPPPTVRRRPPPAGEGAGPKGVAQGTADRAEAPSPELTEAEPSEESYDYGGDDEALSPSPSATSGQTPETEPVLDERESLRDVCVRDPAACPSRDLSKDSSPTTQTSSMQVEQKRGCGCHIAGRPASRGLWAGLALFGLWAVRRRQGKRQLKRRPWPGT